MKLFSRIVIIGCILVFFILTFDLAPYQKHHQKNSLISGEAVFIPDVSLRVSPGNESWLVEKIEKAQKRVWIAVYSFTLPGLRESLLQAKKRGVDVQILLEEFPYGNTSINRETVKFFEDNSLSYHESGPEQFAFMHAKYSIIDDEWIIETANWTRSSFSTNREFFINGYDLGVLGDLIEMFQDDFAGGKGISTNSSIIAGPTNTRDRLQKYIKNTRKELDIYTPSFTDTLLLTDLTQLCYQHKVIRILLDKNDEKRPNYGTCLQVRIMKKPLHAKVIIRDTVDAFVGSFNFTKNSLENNREVGIFVSGETVRTIEKIFEDDWRIATK